MYVRNNFYGVWPPNEFVFYLRAEILSEMVEFLFYAKILHKSMLFLRFLQKKDKLL